MKTLRVWAISCLLMMVLLPSFFATRGFGFDRRTQYDVKTYDIQLKVNPGQATLSYPEWLA
ncbi:MAG: hypothetical protein GXO76_01375 [Calditrichaeota bacterium]|nr:hypothetical protein [Calditrichota bacterium]